jgi:PAS domain S-box-containing protein
MREPATSRRIPVVARLISAAAVATPLLCGLLPGADPTGPLAVLWLLALVPVFVLAHHTGWRGAALAATAGIGMFCLSLVIGAALGRPLPELPAALLAGSVYLGIALGAGWSAELLRRRSSLAAESGGEVVLVVSPHGVLRYASPSSSTVLGQEPRRLEGKRLEQLLETGSAGEFLARLNSALRGDALELRFQAEGGPRVLDVLVQDGEEVSGRPGFILRGRDVTDRRRAEAQARRIARMQAISALAGALAHEFNNALTTSRAMSTCCARTSLPSTAPWFRCSTSSAPRSGPRALSKCCSPSPGSRCSDPGR